MPTKPDPIQIRLPPDSPTSNPTSDIFSLTSRFIHTIQRTTDLRYNLWWTFGTFLEDVPRRLGANEALDRSVEALAAAHAGFCGLSRTGATVEALTKYSQALRTLRVYLDDRVHAQTSNTLCAVMILLICQLFLGQTNQCWSGHAEGATQILRARKRHKPRDLFEQKLFLSLRGSIVSSSQFFCSSFILNYYYALFYHLPNIIQLFEGLFNERIKLSPTEWDELITNEYDSHTPEGRILRNLSKGPNLMHQGREIINTASDPTPLYNEIHSIYQSCQKDLSELRTQATNNDILTTNLQGVPRHSQKFVSEFFYAHYQRTYGIGLVVTLFFNCMLGALGSHGDMVNGYGCSDVIENDAAYFAEEVLALAERSEIYRPIGAGYLLICLSAAWAATNDPFLKARVMVVLNDYHSDFRVRDRTFMMRELEWTAEHLRLGVPFGVNGVRHYPETAL